VKETTYELRDLCSKDIFPMFKIISKIGVKEFKKCFESDEVKQMIASGGTDNVDSIGMTIIMDVVSIVVDNMRKRYLQAFVRTFRNERIRDCRTSYEHVCQNGN